MHLPLKLEDTKFIVEVKVYQKVYRWLRKKSMAMRSSQRNRKTCTCLYVMCCMKAPTIFLVTWKTVSFDHPLWDSCSTMRLCSRTQTVWREASTGFSLARFSPKNTFWSQLLCCQAFKILIFFAVHGKS